jgi:hypothetical protein
MRTTDADGHAHRSPAENNGTVGNIAKAAESNGHAETATPKSKRPRRD